ncbi:hypothetical protein ACIRRH_34580 [Kitasatospora sp. NPDC101235]|uniref:hypothetical protein n=1 Tax=Kitasatospora sp. NPDC101235 TaxID=3364101 RepID=UPI0038087AD3
MDIPFRPGRQTPSNRPRSNGWTFFEKASFHWGIGYLMASQKQAARILRHRTDLATGTVSRQTIYAITDLTSQEASPERLGRLARSQWTIEAGRGRRGRDG